MKNNIKLNCYSEDGASVYEVHDLNKADEFGRTYAIDSLYIGADDWRYGDRKEIDLKIKNFKNKYGLELNEK